MPKLNLEINNQFNLLAHPEGATKVLFHTIEASGQFPIKPGELSVAFVDDSLIAQIHADFMNDPTPTDVITFPANEEMGSAGEIIVSVDHARARATELSEPFAQELTLYLIHGWLHLAGFDDRSKKDKADMRAAERKAFDILEKTGQTIDFQLPQYPSEQSNIKRLYDFI